MNPTFGEKLKKIMKDKKLIQEDLAKHIGRAQATISGYMNDNIDPNLTVIEQIADFVGMTPGQLLDYDVNHKEEVIAEDGEA